MHFISLMKNIFSLKSILVDIYLQLAMKSITTREFCQTAAKPLSSFTHIMFLRVKYELLKGKVCGCHEKTLRWKIVLKLHYVHVTVLSPGSDVGLPADVLRCKKNT